MDITPTKKCCKCLEVLAINQFAIRADSGTRSSYCKACKKVLTKESMKRWYQKHREAVLERNKAWRSRNLEKVRERSQAYYAANKETRRAYAKNWRKNNLETVREQSHIKKDRIRKASTGVPVRKREIYEREAGICWLCGKFLEYDDATTDHVVPLSRGGIHDPSNVRIACPTCNQKKYNHIITEERSFSPQNKQTSPHD